MPDFRRPLQDYFLEDNGPFAIPSSSLHPFYILRQRIDEDVADSPRYDIVALGRECDNIPLVSLPQLVVGDAAIKLCSIGVMKRSTVRYI